MRFVYALCALLISATAFAQGIQTRSYLPSGYVSSVPRHAAPMGAMTAGSLNWLYDPVEKKLIRRAGYAAFDSGLTNVSSAPMHARAMQILQTASYDISPYSGVTRLQYPGLAMLMADESAGERMASLYVKDGDYTLGNFYILGSEAGNAWRFGVSGSDKQIDTHKFIMTPLWSYTFGVHRALGAGTTVRNLFGAYMQGQILSGSRKVIQVGNWLYGPSATGTPVMWNGSFNSDTAGTNAYVNRIRPWGNYPPLFCPVVNDSGQTRFGTSTTQNRSWSEGQKFYVSVLFKFEDGSYGPPVVPDLTFPKGGIGSSTYGAVGDRSGYVQLPDDGDSITEFWDAIFWHNIPIGPDGTVARVLLRTPKTTLTTGSPSFRDLRITAVIPNNTQTSYLDPNGDDNALIVNDEIVRFDHIWPQRAQYVFGNDARIVIGGRMAPNPAAILLAPTGVDTTRDLNAQPAAISTQYVGYRDSDALTGTSGTGAPMPTNDAFGFQVKADSLILVYINASTQARDAYAFRTYPTIRELVKAINNTRVTSPAREWAAQVAPGADDATRSSDLYVHIGTYGGTGDSLRFAPSAVTPANNKLIQWVRSPSWPGVVYYSRAWSDGFKPDYQSIYFTGASPGHAQSAANNFYVGNKRTPPNRKIGKFMGGAPLKDRFIICYENAIYVLANRKGGTTGEDQDYRLFPLNEDRGCVAWQSVVAGDGWVGYMTPDGYVVTDSENEVLISSDVYDGQKDTGDWSYEMSQARPVSSLIDPLVDSTTVYFSAAINNSRLNICYRSSGSTARPDRRLIYDYSGGSSASGLAQVTDNGKPWGWSSPLGDNVSAMGVAQVDASGPYFFGAVEKLTTNAFLRLDKLDTSITPTLPAMAYLNTDFCETLQLKSAEQVYALYNKSETPLTDADSLSVHLALNGSRSTYYSNRLANNGDANLPYMRTVIDLPVAAKSNASAFELLIRDSGVGYRSELWTIAIRYRLLDSVR